MTARVLLPLDHVLRLVAAEVEAMGNLAALAEGTLARALDAVARPVPPGMLRDAQGLDELAQRIAGLRAYLDQIGREAPRDMVLDVSAGVAALPLAAQADRLSGRDEAAARTGAVELF